MKKYAVFTIVSLVTVLLIIYPSAASDGISNALIICAEVIIPSLFPFTACILILMRCNAAYIFKPLERITLRLFHHNADMAMVMLFSLVGGYPVGARLISELYRENKVSLKNAQLMLYYCINAGPAFIVSAVGSGILHSQKVGFILLVSHIIPSVITALILAAITDTPPKSKNACNNSFCFADTFVSSVSDSAASVFSICIFIIIFSVINSYISYFSQSIKYLNKLLLFTEVTLGCGRAESVYTISFLLGFSGLCIWCQIASVYKGIKIKWSAFAFFRILHGTLSAAICYVLLKFFKMQIETVSTNTYFEKAATFSGFRITIALIIMVIVFVISLESKNRGRKIIDDLV